MILYPKQRVKIRNMPYIEAYCDVLDRYGLPITTNKLLVLGQEIIPLLIFDISNETAAYLKYQSQFYVVPYILTVKALVGDESTILFQKQQTASLPAGTVTRIQSMPFRITQDLPDTAGILVSVNLNNLPNSLFQYETEKGNSVAFKTLRM